MLPAAPPRKACGENRAARASLRYGEATNAADSRWAAARLAVQLVEARAARRQGPLPMAYNDLLGPSHGADFTLTQGGGPTQGANQGRGLDSPNP